VERLSCWRPADLADPLDLAAGVPTLPARWSTSTLPPTSTFGA
jgi:hypothetical protein